MNRQAITLRCREALSRLRARYPFRRVLRLGLAVTGLGILAISVEALVRATLDTPERRIPSAVYTRATSWIGDDDEPTPIAIGTLDGSSLEARVPVRLTDVSDNLVQAVLAVEDQRFYQHHGLDLRRIGGALLANIRAVGIVQGGSTLTQQLSKNLFLHAGRTPLRKIREVAMAVVLEARYGKDTILEAYLNEIYLGQDGHHAIRGIGAAARFYFGKSADALSLSESALLAGMISAPNRTAPTRHPVVAVERRNLVLRLMAQQERISRSSALRAGRARLGTRAHPTPALDSRYFRDFAVTSLTRGLPARGVAVYTTLDATLQHAAERAVRNHLDRLQLRGAEAALLAIDPRTGEVLAMVGGRDYGASQFNRSTDARRQPGSAFKPIVALAALEQWKGKAPAFTLASVIEDSPLRVKTPKGPWEPANYDGGFRGPVTFRQAMEQSLNVPFARIGLAVGPQRIVATARKLGIQSPLAAVPSLALGSSEVTLLELVRAYGVLASGGHLADTRAIVGQARYGETVPEQARAEPVQVIDPAVTYLVTSSLEGVVQRGTGRALNESGRWEGVAGKTGTSNDWRDAWFVAYSANLVVGVWVGFDDGRSLKLTGAGAALPIVASFFRQLNEAVGREPFEVPQGISQGYVQLARGDSWGECGTREVFLEGTEPDGEDCGWQAAHQWESLRDWGRDMERRARRYLEEVIAERLDRRGPRR